MRFSEWVEKNHPESIEEGFLKNAALALGAAGAIAAGASAIGGRGMNSHQNRPSATRIDDDFDDDDDDGERSMMAKEAKLRSAAQRVGIPKSQWNNLKGRMIGGVVTVVNGKKVPLTPKEASHVKAVQELARRMGN